MEEFTTITATNERLDIMFYDINYNINHKTNEFILGDRCAFTKSIQLSKYDGIEDLKKMAYDYLESNSDFIEKRIIHKCGLTKSELRHLIKLNVKSLQTEILKDNLVDYGNTLITNSVMNELYELSENLTGIKVVINDNMKNNEFYILHNGSDSMPGYRYMRYDKGEEIYHALCEVGFFPHKHARKLVII